MVKTIQNLTVIQTLTRTRAVDSRFRGNDDIQGTCPRHRHSRESGNPAPSEISWARAYAWVTTMVIFSSLGGSEAHGHS